MAKKGLQQQQATGYHVTGMMGIGRGLFLLVSVFSLFHPAALAEEKPLEKPPETSHVDPTDDPYLYIHGFRDWWTSGLQSNNWVPNLDKMNPTDNGSGNWFGLRTKLQNEGYQFGGQWIGTFYGVANGGLSQGVAFDEQLRLFAHLDFEKILGIPGLSGDASVRYRDGRDPNLMTGASSTFNPSAWQGGKGWRMMPFFLTWKSGKILFNTPDFLTISGGWQDPYYYFGNDPLAGQLVNNAYTTKGLGSNGLTYSSSYAAWGGYVKVKPVEWYYIQAGLYGAYPNATKKGNHGLDFQGYAPDASMNGLYFLAETGFTPRIGPKGLPGKYAFGAAYFGVENTGFNGETYPSRYDFYWQFDQMLYRAPSPDEASEPTGRGPSFRRTMGQNKPMDVSSEGLYWFSWFNFAPAVDNAIPFYFQTGLSYKGLIPGRRWDQAIFGIAYGTFSHDQLQVQEANGSNQQTYEGEFEFSYKVQVTKWAYIQPYIQYIFHTGGAGAVENATVLGFQTGVNF